jgi:hypothetical protein
MSHIKKVVFALTIVLIWFLAVADHAEAYLDPGSGSMIIQAVLAGVAAVSVTIGVFWQKLRAFFRQLFGKDGEYGDDC